jgi:hypothetical protein
MAPERGRMIDSTLDGDWTATVWLNIRVLQMHFLITLQYLQDHLLVDENST